MINLKTSIVTRLPESLAASRLHKSVIQDLNFNLSVLPDSVFSSSSELKNPSRLSLASVAYCKSLIYTLRIEVVDNVEDGFFYNEEDHTLYCDSRYRQQGIKYPAGIRLPLELIKMITPCTLLRNDEVSNFANYSELAMENYFIKEAMDNRDVDEVTSLFKDFAIHYVDPSLKESTEYMLYVAKWFGDSKPSYISTEFAQQISDILEIQGQIIEDMYETEGVVSAGVRQKTTEYLDSIYRDDDIKDVLLTKEFADFLKSQMLRSNDTNMDFSRSALAKKAKTVNLFDIQDEWDFESAYQTIKQIIEYSEFVSTRVSSKDIGLFAKKSSRDVQFILSYGESSIEIDAQVAWWCLVLS